MKNEILELTKDQIQAIQKSFQTVTQADESNKVIVHDWLDDSVQIRTVKGE